MDRIVMGFICPMFIELTMTCWAFDFLQLAGPNFSLFITTTSRGNAVFILRITYDVARMDHSKFFNGISAYN